KIEKQEPVKYGMIEGSEVRSRLRSTKSCNDLFKSGKTATEVYTIEPDGQGTFRVRCVMETTPGRGLTIFQRRVDGSEDFYRDWTDYKTGFGNLSGGILVWLVWTRFIVSQPVGRKY
ncbi:Hypothetical predicted protein, partial [Paramuricea clavata]